MLYLSKHDPGKHKKAMLTLAAIKETGGPDGGYDSEESDGNGYGADLQRLDVTTMPTEGVEVDVGNGIKLMKMKAEDDGGDSGKANFRTETTTIVLSSTAPNAEEVINAFVDKAFAWYKANNLQKKDEKRYMFVMIRPRVGGSSEERSQPGAEPHLYKRYALSDEKTFSSLFFPDKPQARSSPSERLARLLLCGPRPR